MARSVSLPMVSHAPQSLQETNRISGALTCIDDKVLTSGQSSGSRSGFDRDKGYQFLKSSKVSVAPGTSFLGAGLGGQYGNGSKSLEGATTATTAYGRGGITAAVGRGRRRTARPSRTPDDAHFLRDLQSFLADLGGPADQMPSVRQLEQYGRRDLAEGLRQRGAKAVQEQLMHQRGWSHSGDSPGDLNITPNGTHHGHIFDNPPVLDAIPTASLNLSPASTSASRVQATMEEALRSADEEKRKHEAALRERAAMFLTTGQLGSNLQAAVSTEEGASVGTEASHYSGVEGPPKVGLDAALLKEATKSRPSPWSLSEEAVAAQKAALLKARLKRRQALDSAQPAAPAGNAPASAAPSVDSSQSQEATSLADRAARKISPASPEFDFSAAMPEAHADALPAVSRQQATYPQAPYAAAAAPIESRHVAAPSPSGATLREFLSTGTSHPTGQQTYAPESSASMAGSPPFNLSFFPRDAETGAPLEMPNCLDAAEADETIRQLKLENEGLFHDILAKQQEIEAMSLREKQLQQEFKFETQRELQHIKTALEAREVEVASMVRELEEAKVQFKLMRAKAMAELAQTQQLLAEKDQRLKSAEQALRHLKKVKVEYWGAGNDVKLAGSFNGWRSFVELHPDPSSAIPGSDGSRGPMLWDAEIYLYPGTYQVKFIVDGKWVLDTRRKVCTSDMGQNNLIQVEDDA